MNIKVKDTSKDYEHLVDYRAEVPVTSTLEKIIFEDGEFVEESIDTGPEIKYKSTDKDFPEPWQTITVNLYSFEGYVDFMARIGSVPTPKLSTHIYEKEPDNGLLNFFANEDSD